MRAPLRLGCLLSLGIASSSSAVTMEWRPIGDPGNPCYTHPYQPCQGTVDYSYSIGTYEVTNAQYSEFLNAVARTSDPVGLYHVYMGNPTRPYEGGIGRSGNLGNLTYYAIAGRENLPVNWVTFFDALRFANWMSNGQPTGAEGAGTTETGAYTLDGLTPTPSNGDTVHRNVDATIFVPSDNEWYKAAYYAPQSTSYFEYPTSSNSTTCSPPTAESRRANCYYGSTDVKPTPIGSYTGSPSPYGTFDQGGNVAEWSDTLSISNEGYALRGLRGGVYNATYELLAASSAVGGTYPSETDANRGFRVVMALPEPSTNLVMIAGAALLGLAARRRAAHDRR